VYLLQNKTPRIITDWVPEVCEVLKECGLDVFCNICKDETKYSEIHLTPSWAIE
jgi:hypothetical protein